MDAPVMLKCGCAAMAVCSKKGGVTYDPPVPACVAHDCIEVDDAPPSLEGRKARCAYFGPINFRNFESNYVKQTGCSRQRCTCELPSSPGLPFFEYQGPGSLRAGKCKHCGYFKIAHAPGPASPRPGWRPVECRQYEPRGDIGYDRFFCGCAGWD